MTITVDLKETVTEMIDESANGCEIRLSCGETFEIRLEERPTTGYRWRIVSDGAPACTLVGDSFEAPSDVVPGRSGRHSWTFRVEHPGRARIELVSRRASGQDTTPARLFRISVTAAD